MSNQDTTQAKFRKASKKDSEQPQIEENEVRIKGNMGNVKRYVDYACGLLKNDDRARHFENKDDKPRSFENNDDKTRQFENKDDDNNDNNNDNNNEDNNANDANENKDDKKDDEKKKVPKQFKTIVLKATGRAINKAVTTAEVVKRRVAGLHQDTKLETLEIVDVWEPTEEGLLTVETTRRVASITITLSLDENEIVKMKQSSGYQSPLSSDSVKTTDYPIYNRRGSRGRRGGFNRNYGSYGSYGSYGGYGGYGGRRGGYGNRFGGYTRGGRARRGGYSNRRGGRNRY